MATRTVAGMFSIRLLLAVVTGAIASQTGYGDVIQHTVSIGPVSAWQDPKFQFPQFDSSLGSLSGITIEYFAPLSASYTGQNTSGSARNITDTFFGFFSITGPGFNQMRRDFSMAGSRTIQPGQVISLDLGATTLRSGLLNLSADRFDGYRGLGTVSLGSGFVASDTVTPASAALVMNDRIDYLLSATVTVGYTYAAIPEPPKSVIAAGLAMLAVPIWRGARRRPC